MKGAHLLRAWIAVSFTLLASCSSCGSDPESPATSTPVPPQVYSGFDFTKEAFTFENFGGGAQAVRLTQRSMQRMFGDEAVCVPQSDPCVLTAQAELWMEGTNRTLDQGRSEGFAILSLQFFSGALDPEDFGAESVADLQIQGNLPLQEELAYWAATQAVPAAAVNDVRYQADTVLPFLATALAPESARHYRLAIAQRTAQGFARGHALTPLGYFKDDQREDTYWLRVYDNNFPSREQVLELHPEANTWRYQVPGIDGTPIVYEGSPEKINHLYFSAIQDRSGVLAAPFAEGSEYLAQTVSGATIVASNADGEETGIRDGEVIEAEGDWVTPAFARCPLCGTAVPIVNQATLAKGLKPKNNITITSAPGISSESSAEEGTVTVQNYGLGFSSTLESENPQVGDSVLFEAGGDVSYSSTMGGGEVTISSNRVNGDGSRTIVTITVDGEGSPVSIYLDNNEDGTTSVDVSGLPAGSEVTVTVTTRGDDGATTTNTFDYTSNGEDAKVNVASGTDTVTLQTDPADAAICKNGAKDESESDLDCGGGCGATCAIGKGCGNDGDCASGYCEGGLCSELDPTCTSGTLSPGETGIDCGGTTCTTRCKALAGEDSPGCMIGSDCDTGICAESKCRLKYPVFVEFDRLPTGQNWVGLYTKLDGVTTFKGIELVEGTLRYEIGSAYAFQFVSATSCSALVPGEQRGDATTMQGTLKMRCPPPNEKHMIVRIVNYHINTYTTPSYVDKLANDPIKFVVSVDDGPLQLVEVTTMTTDLGVYQNTWKIGLIQGPQDTDYKVIGGGTGPIKAEYYFRPGVANNWTDTALFIADKNVEYVSWSVYKAGRYGPPSCSDREFNQNETGLDCGGKCPKCKENRLCLKDDDCASGLSCANYVCRPSGTCSDGVKNQDESDIDCGGSCSTKCVVGKACTYKGDCATGAACTNNVCASDLCIDAIKNQDETDIDCGGSTCSDRCAGGQSCATAFDCESGLGCIDSLCAIDYCDNGVKDADESDIDCGGTSRCDRCDRFKACTADTDCASGNICQGNQCFSALCDNSMYDSGEGDVDCGMVCYEKCAQGRFCSSDADCVSGLFCRGGSVCEDPLCFNNMKDNGEGDIDCGGSCTVKCAVGQACTQSSDCVAGNSCQGNVCTMLDPCMNGIQDAGELDIDCGGSCGTCGISKKCSVDSDCTSGSCECGLSSGACTGASGKCGAGRWVIDQPTSNGTAPSSTVTIPADCPQVFLQAWGAAGGSSDDGTGFALAAGGAGGFVSGPMSVAPGDSLKVWIGQGGDAAIGASPQPVGSRYGTLATGGQGHIGPGFVAGGSGGALTSVQRNTSTTDRFVVPAGSGSSFQFGEGADVAAGFGGGSPNSSGVSAFSSANGGGGAGEEGGDVNTAGTYGPLPAGMITEDGFAGVPANTSSFDYTSCLGQTNGDPGAGQGAQAPLARGGDGCVIVRCMAP